jgi:hypothetical protein
MARLIVNAVSNETRSSDLVNHLVLYVSVSHAKDGKPVTGLTDANFRVASSVGSVIQAVVQSAYEGRWEPDDQEPAGCYRLSVFRDPTSPLGSWRQGECYAFGVQVRTFREVGKGRRKHAVPADHGQTVVAVESFGK